MPPSNEVVQAIKAISNAPSYERMRAILETNRHLLLTDEADQAMKELIDFGTQRGEDVQRLAEFVLLRTLFRNSRKFGIPLAWSVFIEGVKGIMGL